MEEIRWIKKHYDSNADKTAYWKTIWAIYYQK